MGPRPPRLGYLWRGVGGAAKDSIRQRRASSCAESWSMFQTNLVRDDGLFSQALWWGQDPVTTQHCWTMPHD